MENLRENGEIVYGVHASSRAYITCLIADHAAHHIHLVDGAEGGYAMAARQMKSQATPF